MSDKTVILLFAWSLLAIVVMLGILVTGHKSPQSDNSDKTEE